MKSERLKGMMMPPSTERTFNYYTSVQTLPRVRNCTEFSNTESSHDVEEYYPFVIGRGKNFKIIDPKLYKQLRKHNIHHTKKVPVWSDRAKTNSYTRTPESRRPVETHLYAPGTIDSEDEYCELSPLAKSPPPLPPRKAAKKVVSNPVKLDRDLCSDFKKAPTLEKRLCLNSYNSPKAWKVECSPDSPTSLPTTKLVSGVESDKAPWPCEDDGDDVARGTLCGVDTEEAIDYATCMCCVKGLFYHCTKDTEDEGRIADEPCSCTGPLKSCLPRWGCLAVLSVLMPCIWCYLPIAGCRKACKHKSKSHKGKSKKKEKLTS